MRRPLRRRRGARLACGLAVGALAALLAGCGIGGTTPQIPVSAVFSDVGGLVTGASVQMADVPVGHVTGITLDGDRARVTMAIDADARVPADVTAELEYTTVLGERFIDLVAPRRPDAPLEAGGTIAHTEVVPGVEQLVGAGAQVFGAVSTTELAEIVAAGGEGFDDQAATLREFLGDLSTVTTGYAAHTQQIQTVIDSLDQLGSSLAPTSGADAQALGTLAQTVTLLAKESTQFAGSLQALDTLAIQGNSLLATYFPQMTDQLRALDATASQLAAHQQDLAGLLQYIPLHDATTQSATRTHFIQVLDTIIVCGIPHGGSNTTPAFRCPSSGTGGG